MRVAAPSGYEPPAVVDGARPAVDQTDPVEAVKEADAVYTDVWASMGQEDEAEARRAAFEGFTVDAGADGSRRGPDAIFLHCLPAHRGEEVAAEVHRRARRAWCGSRPRTACTRQRGLLLWLLRGRA